MLYFSCQRNPPQRKADPMSNKKKNQGGSCDSCTYFTYDEDYESYVCDIDMDEDEYARLASDSHYSCPYYRNGDEYLVVRHQM